MKKSILLNSKISYAISKMGHTDKIVIADAGLPIPKKENRIDLALKQGVPTFIETFDTIVEELKVEKMILADEIRKNNLDILKHLERFAKINDVVVEFVTHESFKQLTNDSTAIIRTGECSPYANVILCSGVTF